MQPINRIPLARKYISLGRLLSLGFSLLALAMVPTMAPAASTYSNPTPVNPTLTWVSGGTYSTSTGTYAVGDVIRANGTASAGLAANTFYYVIAVSSPNITLSAAPGGSAVTGAAGSNVAKKVVNWNDSASWDTIPNGVDAIANINDSNLGGSGLGFGANTTVGAISLTSASSQDFSLLGQANGTAVYTLTLATSSGTPAFTNSSTKIFGLPGTAAQNQKLKLVGTQGLAVYSPGAGGFRLCSGLDWSGLTGTFTIAQGSFAPQAGGLMPTANRVVVGASSSTATLGFISGRDQSFEGLDGNFLGILSGGGNLTLGPNSTSADSFNFAGSLQMGAGSLTWNGAGTQILSGTNTYTGSTTISAGTLQFKIENSLYSNQIAAAWSATKIIVSSGATLALNVGGAGEFTTADVATIAALGTSTGGLKSGAILALDTTDAGGSFTHGSAINNPNSGANTLGLTKLGTGTLILNAACGYSGATTVKAGNLQVTGLTGSGAVTVAAGASLSGAGTIAGTTTINGYVYPGTDGTAGTLTFSSSLTLSSGATNCFDVSGSAASGNDQVICNNGLTLNGNIFAIKGPATLDTSADYVLVTNVSGTFSGTAASAVTWVGTAPNNSANFTIVTSGNAVKLHYNAAIPPSVTATATPASAYRNQTTTITATVTVGSQPVSTVTIDASPIGGSSTASLVLSNNNVYTNSFTISAGATVGSKTLNVTVTDTSSPTALTGTFPLAFNVVAGTETWGGGAGDANWSSAANWTGGVAPGLSGDSLIFAGAVNLAPNMDNNYSVAAMTFDVTAAGFTIGTTASTLTLSGGLTNNSANAQTLNVPVALIGAPTVNAAAGNIVLGGVVSGSGATLVKSGANSLTLSGANTYSGGTTINAGTVQLGNASALGSGAVNLGAAATLDLNAQTVANAVSTISSGAIITNSSGTAAAVSTAMGNASSSQLGNFTVGTAGNMSLNDVYGAQFGCTLTKTGNGALTLGGTGVNGVSGNPLQLIVSGGTVTLAKTSSGTVADGVTVNAGAVLQMDPLHTSTGWQAWAGQLNAGVSLAGGTLDLNGVSGKNNLVRFLSGATGFVTNSSTAPAELEVTTREANSLYTFSGNIVDGLGGGTVSVTFTNSGAINSGRTNIFAGNNTYSGDTLVGYGTFELGSANAAQNSTVNLAASSGLGTGASLFEFANGIGTFTIGGLKGSQNFTLADVAGSAVTLGIGNNGGSTTYSGIMSDAGGINKIGGGTLTLSQANTYTGNTVVSAGTLALSSSGSINSTPSIAIGAGATFDVSAISAYSLSSSTALSASGTASPATITGASGGTVSLGSRPITLTYDGAHPALTISQGTLSLNGNAFTVNTASALGSGNYTIVQQASGNITASGSFSVSGTAIDSTHYGTISVSGGSVVLTVAVKPTAGMVTYSRSPGVGLKVFVSNLITNDTVDTVLGYTTNYVSCAATTANGASLVTTGTGNSTIILYPSSAANTADSFSYTISDGHGGTATGTVNITINNNVTGQSTINFAGQTATLGFFGIPGYHYVVQRSVDSLNNWQDLTSVTTADVVPSGTSVDANGVIMAPATGGFTVTDPAPPSNPTSVYYRLRSAP